MKNVVLIAAIAVGLGFTVHRSFRNGYPAEWNVSSVESRLMRPLGEQSVHFAGRTNGERSIEGRVTRVSDGDTIWVTDASNMRHKVRLLDIDAPESSQKFGAESTRQLQSMIGGKSVRVTYRERDQYGRVLGTVWLDDQEVNLAMVTSGFAWVYHYCKTPKYVIAQQLAKKKGVGLWADSDAQDPWAFRRGLKNAGRTTPRVEKQTSTGRKEYYAGNGPVSQRVAAPVNDDWPDTGYWLSTNSNKRHNRRCENYRKTRGYPCGKGDGVPCGKCGG